MIADIQMADEPSARALAVLRNGDETRVPGRRELRLVNVAEGDLVFAWVSAADSRISDALRVPRKLIDDIEAEPAAWQALRDDVGEGLVVDFQREMLTE